MADEAEISATEKANDLMAALLERVPKGFAAPSMGKFNEFRKWLAEALQLGDWKTNTYAVGSAGIAHNFGSRWTQNNAIAGRRVPLGLAFISVPPGANEDALLETVLHTNEKFVDGSRSTSYETILNFVQPHGQKTIKAHSIQSIPGSPTTAKLLKLFPGLPVREVTWVGEGVPSANAPHTSTAAVPKPFDGGLLSVLEQVFEDANYQAPAGLAERVISALAAKPFLILAGLSGSGKTLLAIAISRWLCATADQVQVVAVGADWTSAHHLLGYPDALDQARYVRTPALDLLIRASESPELPFFLILDEMNLSHVERYFSDFLSAMESGESLSLHGADGERDGVEPSLRFPKNLFVVGTINVDETTYMFSPKVIDRANVIEFTVSGAAMETYLAGNTEFSPAAIQGMGGAYGASLVDFVGDAVTLDGMNAVQAQAVRSALFGLFAVLDRAGLQFGFRTAREMIRYAVASRQLMGSAWHIRPMIDAQVAQRLLPRLSGDSSKLRPVLVGLLAYFEIADPDAGSAIDQEQIAVKSAELKKLQPETLQAVCGGLVGNYPISADKIGRMLRRLNEQGFTTAIEA